MFLSTHGTKDREIDKGIGREREKERERKKERERERKQLRENYGGLEKLRNKRERENFERKNEGEKD